MNDTPVDTTTCSQLRQRSVRSNLLGINHECREIILDMVLQNKAQAWIETTIDDDVLPINLRIPRIPREDDHIPQFRISKDRIHIGNVNILLVCHQLYSEGTQILYGRNSFVSYNFPQLKYRLPAVIGRRNMRLIRKVTLGLPMKHKRDDPALYLGGFLEFLKEKLPNLSDLTLTTQFGRLDSPFVDDGTITRVSEEHRAMLNTAVWITCRHPQLKKAIWLAESGGILRTPLPGVPGDEYDPVSHAMSGAGEEIDVGAEAQNTVSHVDEGDVFTDGAAESGVNDYAMEIATGNDNFSGDLAPNASDEALIDSVYTCRLTVKILAEDRRFRIQKKVRIDLMPHIRKVVASVCFDVSVCDHVC